MTPVSIISDMAAAELDKLNEPTPAPVAPAAPAEAESESESDPEEKKSVLLYLNRKSATMMGRAANGR